MKENTISKPWLAKQKIYSRTKHHLVQINSTTSIEDIAYHENIHLVELFIQLNAIPNIEACIITYDHIYSNTINSWQINSASLWYLDSNATYYITRNQHIFLKLYFNFTTIIKMIGRYNHHVLGIETVDIKFLCGNIKTINHILKFLVSH